MGSLERTHITPKEFLPTLSSLIEKIFRGSKGYSKDFLKNIADFVNLTRVPYVPGREVSDRIRQRLEETTQRVTYNAESPESGRCEPWGSLQGLCTWGIIAKHLGIQYDFDPALLPIIDFELHHFDYEREFRNFGNFSPLDLIYFAKINDQAEFLEGRQINPLDERCRNVEIRKATPDEMVIHYQDIRTGKGNWIVYDKKTETLKTKLEGDLESILIEFGRTAAKVEQKFGKVQQVEIGYSDHGVEVYQSRDLNLGNAAAVPRFAHYKTFSKDLRANGFGYFHLPVLVIDSLSNFSEECGLSRAEKIERVVKPYKAELQRFMEQHPEYIVIVKDGELFEPWYSGKTERELGFVSKEEKYAELNAVTRRAKVMFAGRNQNAIRHEDWDNVESGGINIWMGEQEKLNNLFAHKSRYDKYRFPDREESVSQNLTLLRGITPIKTGDYLHVLSNLDGVFVWRD